VNPAITILDYLWSMRKTGWLKHHENCSCDFEKLAADYIEGTLTVDQWAEVVISTNFGAIIREKRKTADEWDELCGPKAQDRQLQEALDQHMDAVTQIMALQASKERLSSD